MGLPEQRWAFLRDIRCPHSAAARWVEVSRQTRIRDLETRSVPLNLQARLTDAELCPGLMGCGPMQAAHFQDKRRICPGPSALEAVKFDREEISGLATATPISTSLLHSRRDPEVAVDVMN